MTSTLRRRGLIGCSLRELSWGSDEDPPAKEWIRRHGLSRGLKKLLRGPFEAQDKVKSGASTGATTFGVTKGAIQPSKILIGRKRKSDLKRLKVSDIILLVFDFTLTTAASCCRPLRTARAGVSCRGEKPAL